MPPVIIAAIGYVVGVVSIVQVVLVAVAWTVSEYQRKKAAREARRAYNASLQDRLVMQAVCDAPRSRVYGQVRNVDGVIFKASRGANREFYTLVVALAGHEITGVNQIFFGDQAVDLDEDGYVQTAPYAKEDSRPGRAAVTVDDGEATYTIPTEIVVGSVGVATSSSSGASGGERDGQRRLAFTLSGHNVHINDSQDFTGTAVVQWQEPTGDSYARVQVFLGDPAQDISAEMVERFPDLCEASDKFRGIALLLVDLEYSPDAYPTGVPPITAKMRGAKVYDPRIEETVYTRNPSLIARDWVRYPYGGGLSLIQTSNANFETQANACDVDLAFTTPGGTVTANAYACDIVCKTGEDPQGWLEEIIESMAGKWGWSGGRLHVVAGAYREPADTLTGEWVSDFDDIEILPTPPRDELFNALRMTIADAAQDYIPVQAPPIVAEPYVEDDGEEFTRELTAMGISSVVRAQYVSSVLLREARASLIVKIPCKHHAWPLELFDVIYVTLPVFGWLLKPFEVLGWGYQHGVGITLTLKEINPDIFEIDAGYNDLGYDDNTSLPGPWETETVFDLAVNSGTDQIEVQADGTLQPRVLVTWHALTLESSRRGTTQVRYGNAADLETTWQTVTVPGGRTSIKLTNVTDREVIYVKARNINLIGCVGPWCPQVIHEVLGKSEAPSNVAGLAATAIGGAVRLMWTPCDDIDYALTEVRRGDSWDTSTRIFRGTASTYDWSWPANGSYTLRVRHADTSGNLSTSSATVDITVGNNVLIGTPHLEDESATHTGYIFNAVGVFRRNAP